MDKLSISIAYKLNYDCWNKADSSEPAFKF
nr:MAG TPA: hypothetical protein [Caudoviricetes sp.]